MGFDEGFFFGFMEGEMLGLMETDKQVIIRTKPSYSRVALRFEPNF